MMRQVLDDAFALAGENSEDYLTYYHLDHMYRLGFSDKDFDIYQDKKKMRDEIGKYFPEDVSGFDQYLEKEKKRFEALIPCLSRDYSSLKQFLNSSKLLKAAPHLSLGKSVHDVLS